MPPLTPPSYLPSLRSKFIQDLEALFDLAFQKEDFSAALKAKELLGREQGFFQMDRKQSKDQKVFPGLKLQDLTDEELAELIQQLEHNSS